MGNWFGAKIGIWYFPLANSTKEQLSLRPFLFDPITPTTTPINANSGHVGRYLRLLKSQTVWWPFRGRNRCTRKTAAPWETCPVVCWWCRHHKAFCRTFCTKPARGCPDKNVLNLWGVRTPPMLVLCLISASLFIGYFSNNKTAKIRPLAFLV